MYNLNSNIDKLKHVITIIVITSAKVVVMRSGPSVCVILAFYLTDCWITAKVISRFH